MKHIFILTILVTLLTGLKLNAQSDSTISKMIEMHYADNQTMNHLDILCNRFGGRLIGSDAYENAADWAAYKFREWGMQVYMDEAGELPVGFNRGPWFGKLISEEGMHLHFSTPSYTSGTKGVQRGHVLIEPKTQKEFDRMKGKLKGAWVLISGQSTGWPIDYTDRSQLLRDSLKIENAKIEEQNQKIRSENWKNRKSGLPKRELLPYIEEPGLFYKEMRDAGILGLIQSAKTPIRVLYDRKNIDSMTFETLSTIPDIKLDEHQYAKIKQMAEERRYFLLEFDIRNHFKLGPIKYNSVIGIIPGTTYADEYVIMSGHLDAFDVATGGVDDGSGVSVSMEAARLIMEAGGKPKRTIIVALWAGEEFGLLGSKSWIKNNPEKLPYISNMVNRDGGPTVPTGLEVPEAMRADFEQICEPIHNINPDFPFELLDRKPREKPKKPWGTDSGPFAVEGVPTIDFELGDPKGYDFSYMEIWHTERDLYNKSIREYQEHASITTAIVVYGIANLDHLLSREGYYIENKDKPDKKEKQEKMILASAQFEPLDGDIDKNLGFHYNLIDLAYTHQVQVIVFPEMSLTGYMREQAEQLAFSENDKRLSELRKLARDYKITIIVGAPILLDNKLHIGSFILKPDNTINIYTKHFLHDGEELVFVASKKNNPIIEIDNNTISFAICADIEHEEHAAMACSNKSTIYIASIFYTNTGIDGGHNKLSGYANKHHMNVLMNNYSGNSYGFKAGGKSAFWNNEGTLIEALDEGSQGLLLVEGDDKQWKSSSIYTAYE